MTPESVAAICHEANRRYCMTIGDASQLSWEEAPEWARTSAINGVRFHLANPNATDAASHQNWLEEKLADGWVYGKVKDPVRKEHPCCVAFDQLPLEQQLKDAQFRAIVNVFRSSIREPAAV